MREFMITYGQYQFLKDWGTGWSRWTTEPWEAGIWSDEVFAQCVAHIVGGTLTPC